MGEMVKSKFVEVEELSELPRATFEKVGVAGVDVLRYTFEPGWNWKEHVGSFTGAASCPAPHILFTVSGRLRVKMDDGSIEEVGEGECIVIPQGHDAWTVGDTPYIGIDFGPQLYEHLAGDARAADSTDL